LGFAAYRFRIGLFFKNGEICRYVLHPSNVLVIEYYFGRIFILGIDQTMVVVVVGGHPE